jgi:hypothetical protein
MMRLQLMAAALIFVQPLIAKVPELSCEKKFGEMKWEGMVFHRYRLRAENFPPKQTFRLIVKSFDGTRTETFRYCANHRGHLIFVPPEDAEGDIYAICPVKRGERLTFLMESEEGEEAYAAELVPFPIEMRSKKGIKLSLELNGEQGEKFLFFAQGFRPSEAIRLFLEIEGKEIELEAQVTSLGDLCTMVHFSIGSEGGEAKLVLKRQNEDVVLPFQWGTPAVKCVGACCFEMK